MCTSTDETHACAGPGAIRVALDKKAEATAIPTKAQITAAVDDMLAPAPNVTNALKTVIASLTTRVGGLENETDNSCGSQCFAGQYVSAACTPTQKTVCTACPAGQCMDY